MTKLTFKSLKIKRSGSSRTTSASSFTHTTLFVNGKFGESIFCLDRRIQIFVLNSVRSSSCSRFHVCVSIFIAFRSRLFVRIAQASRSLPPSSALYDFLFVATAFLFAVRTTLAPFSITPATAEYIAAEHSDIR